MTVGTDSSQLSNFQLLFLYLTSVIYYFTFNPSRGCATALVWQYVANFSHWVFGFSNICIPFFSYDVELFYVIRTAINTQAHSPSCTPIPVL